MAVSKAARARRQQAAAERRWAAKDAKAVRRAEVLEELDKARANGMDLSRLGMETNWRKVTRVAVNPHTNKSWNSYANVANERLKRVEYNTGVKTADVVPNFKPKVTDVQRALNNGMTIYTDLSLKK